MYGAAGAGGLAGAPGAGARRFEGPAPVGESAADDKPATRRGARIGLTASGSWPEHAAESPHDKDWAVSSRTITMTDALSAYLHRVSLRESDIQRRLREETAALDYAGMQISPEQGQFMRMLTGLVGARRAIEIGVFTGYSALCVALALPEDGELIACDVSEEWTAMARRYWASAGVASKIRLELAPAADTLDALVRAGRSGEFDIAFIDADKTGYDRYYERCLELLRPGGLILIDNVLWGGAVADEDDPSEDTAALQALNAKLKDDMRIELCMLPVGDGLTLARKLP